MENIIEQINRENREYINKINSIRSGNGKAEKIMYYVESSGHSSMKKVGVYPENATMDKVYKVVNGTFGGIFTLYENGKFDFTAYTD